MKSFIPLFCLIFSSACSSNTTETDASGVFEATEIIVPAEATGILKQFALSEGATLKAGEVIGYIDSLQLYLKKQQLLAQLKATGSRLPDINSQTSFYKQQAAVVRVRLDHLLHEQQRMENLLKLM